MVLAEPPKSSVPRYILGGVRMNLRERSCRRQVRERNGRKQREVAPSIRVPLQQIFVPVGRFGDLLNDEIPFLKQRLHVAPEDKFFSQTA
jgi:hypothetical protein